MFAVLNGVVCGLGAFVLTQYDPHMPWYISMVVLICSAAGFILGTLAVLNKK